MSDTRDEAEQEMVSAGMTSGLEDTLGVSGFFTLIPAGGFSRRESRRNDLTWFKD